MENEILLLGKKILWDRSPVLLDYQPEENWQQLWDPKLGHWEYKDGHLIGSEPGNFGGILLSREYFADNVMMKFTMSTVLPASRDLNAVFCTTWDEEVNYLKKSYVVGLNGWYENKSGIERFPEEELRSLTSLYRYAPGTEVEILTGAIDGHCFLFADGVLVQELIDRDPIKGGHVGFSPYSTALKIGHIQIRKICWEERFQIYEPEGF